MKNSTLKSIAKSLKTCENLKFGAGLWVLLSFPEGVLERNLVKAQPCRIMIQSGLATGLKVCYITAVNSLQPGDTESVFGRNPELSVSWESQNKIP